MEICDINKVEKELFRVKEEDFQKLLDYKRSLKGKNIGGCVTTRKDWETGEYVLVHSDKRWAASIIENTVKMQKNLENLEEYLEAKA